MNSPISPLIPVAIAGAGTMGSGMAQVAAAAGHSVVLFDAFPGVLEKAKKLHEESYRKLVEKGKVTSSDAAAILGRIRYSSEIQDVSSAQLVIEAVVEDLSVKQDLFKKLEDVVAGNCLLASNTSSLSITSIAGACQKPERVLGIHFFNPAPLMPLVEIIPGINTDSAAADAAQKLMDSWGKVTVRVKDTPGFIVNRVARPFYGESIRIFEERWMDLPAGAEGMATIDWAMKEHGGFRMGPFELMDLIGNDVNFTVTETVWKQFFYDARYKPSLTQKRMVEAGRLGRKTKMGYYDYNEGAALPAPDQDPVRAKRIVDRVLCMLINEAVDAAYLQVATPSDIDLAMTKGVNYPKGLLRWCDETGAAHVLKLIEELRAGYNEDRYRPSVLLKRMATQGERFFG